MFARTERLLLRPGWTEDRPALAHLLSAIERDTPLPSSLLQAITEDDAPAMLLQRRTDGDPVLLGLATLIRRPGNAIELGIWIEPDARRAGYALEAGRAMIGMARFAIGAQRVTARMSFRERAAIRLCERLGMHQAGRQTEADRLTFHRLLSVDGVNGAPLAA